MSASETESAIREERAESVKKAFETLSPGRAPEQGSGGAQVDTEVDDD